MTPKRVHRRTLHFMGPGEVRLIAAAPVMLAALKELATLGREGMKPSYSEWLTFHDKVALIAESAIAIATVTESGANPPKAPS